MNIVLWPSLVRYALAAVALVLGIATVLAVRRGKGGLAAALGVGVMLSVGALVGEALVGLTVRLAAPSATDFNHCVCMTCWIRRRMMLLIT